LIVPALGAVLRMPEASIFSAQQKKFLGSEKDKIRGTLKN